MDNPLVRRIGRLHRLAVFEAAARHGSFTGAAAELGITQPGVSRQIRALETALALPLFERHANRVLLTDFGREFLAAVQSGFEVINAVADRPNRASRRFVLAVNPGVAQRWLVPRLDSLQRAMGETEVHLWLFDRDDGVLSGGFDAAIHLGRGPWSDLESRTLFPEVTVPVASPERAELLGLSANTDPAKLLDVDLLHLDDEDRTWMTWSDWFGRHNVKVPRRRQATRPRISYNNYALVTQDAIAGFGVALGWRHLVDDLIDRELLVPVGPQAANDGSSYQILWPRNTSTAELARLLDWLSETLGIVEIQR